MGYHLYGTTSLAVIIAWGFICHNLVSKLMMNEFSVAYMRQNSKQGQLTHLPIVPHISVGELGHHWFRKWFVACSAPSHYLNQWWLISVGPLGTNLNEIWIEIQNFSFLKMLLKLSSAKWWPFCPGADGLKTFSTWVTFSYRKPSRGLFHKGFPNISAIFAIYGISFNWNTITTQNILPGHYISNGKAFVNEALWQSH